MGWENIGGFLDRFKSFKPPKKFMQDEAVEAINRVIGVSVSPDDIEKRGAVIYVKTKNQALKSQIFMNKEKILSEFSKKFGSNCPKEIRF